MAEITLSADTGRPTGSRASRRIRAQGKVPGVVYGLDQDPTPVTVEWPDLRAALTTEAGLNALIDLVVEGEKRMTIVKDMQRDPIRGSVDHVDFLLIRADEAIEVDVPVVLDGEAEAVEREDGIIDQVITELTISAMPANIPNELTVDITELEIGDAIRVGDLRLPTGVETGVDPEEPIVLGSYPTVEEEPAVEEAEALEGAEAEDEAAEAAEVAGDRGGAESDGGDDDTGG